MRLRNGISVGIFPEGGLNRNTRKLNRGRLGIGEIILETGVPVVPVGVDFPVRRKYGKLPVLGRLEITIGKPLSFGHACDEWREIAESPRYNEKERRLKKNELCVEIAHRVMWSIAPLCGKEYNSR